MELFQFHPGPARNFSYETVLLEEVDKFGCECMHLIGYVRQILTEIKFERFLLPLQNLICIREVISDEKTFA